MCFQKMENEKKWPVHLNSAVGSFLLSSSYTTEGPSHTTNMATHTKDLWATLTSHSESLDFVRLKRWKAGEGGVLGEGQ